LESLWQWSWKTYRWSMNSFNTCKQSVISSVHSCVRLFLGLYFPCSNYRIIVTTLCFLSKFVFDYFKNTGESEPLYGLIAFYTTAIPARHADDYPDTWIQGVWRFLIYYLHSRVPVFLNEIGDLPLFRYISFNSFLKELCRNQDFVDIFNVSTVSVWRWKRILSKKGRVHILLLNHVMVGALNYYPKYLNVFRTN